MIRVGKTRARLLGEIARDYPSWVADAKSRTAALAVGGGDSELPSTWSEIKQYYMKMQGSKCIYCEKEIEDQPVEQDVEHFRPKKKVARWPIPKELAGLSISVVQPARDSEPGHPLLAYNPLNYAASCLTCNRALKKNYFPIAGTRDYSSTDPAVMTGERPFLISPISDLDEEPDRPIEFSGLSPQAMGTGFRLHRALVIIWIFSTQSRVASERPST